MFACMSGYMCRQVGVFSTLLSRPRDTTWAPVGHLSVTGGVPVTVRSFFAWAFGGSWYINLDSATQTGMVAWPTGTSVVIQSVGLPGGWDGRGRTGATPCGSGGSGVSPPDIFRVPQPFALGCAELVHFLAEINRWRKRAWPPGAPARQPLIGLWTLRAHPTPLNGAVRGGNFAGGFFSRQHWGWPCKRGFYPADHWSRRRGCGSPALMHGSSVPNYTAPTLVARLLLLLACRRGGAV